MIKTVGIVGLGLIGGSMAKSIKKHSDCRVYAFDIKESTMKQALDSGAIDGKLENLSTVDLLVVALFPQDTVNYVKEHAGQLHPGAIICDICGVKEKIIPEAAVACRAAGVEFIGCHPMAGREKWGFENSDENLFSHASMIMTPEGADEQQVQELEDFWKKIGVGRTVRTTAENHDRMIGYTSQLAHVLSNAYIKNPLSMEFSGYTGGSFQDLTRVAKLNPVMWSELFFCNRENLLRDVSVLIDRLEEYRQALLNNDPEEMTRLLKEGSAKKEELLRKKEREQ